MRSRRTTSMQIPEFRSVVSLPERKHQRRWPIIVALGDIIQLYKFHCRERRHWNSLRPGKGRLRSRSAAASVRRSHHRLQPPTHGKLNCPSLKLFNFRSPSKEFKSLFLTLRRCLSPSLPPIIYSDQNSPFIRTFKLPQRHGKCFWQRRLLFTLVSTVSIPVFR